MTRTIAHATHPLRCAISVRCAISTILRALTSHALPSWPHRGKSPPPPPPHWTLWPNVLRPGSRESRTRCLRAPSTSSYHELTPRHDVDYTYCAQFPRTSRIRHKPNQFLLAAALPPTAPRVRVRARARNGLSDVRKHPTSHLPPHGSPSSKPPR